ncbi:MAG: nitrous oxide reductase family maturation protein NosD [Bacteroidota bacterium]
MRPFFFILSFFCSCIAYSRTIYVGAHREYKNIQAALAIALDGDTILVDAGHYREHTLVITKRITLKGLQYPVIDGEKKYEIIAVKANGVVIDGFRVVHSGVSSLDDISGIKIYDRKNVVIKNNILEDTFFGIYTQNGTNCVIQNNQITAYSKEEQQSGNGIHCWKSDSMQIIGNSISGHRDGIYFEFVTHSVIWRNHSSKNMRYGLHFMFSHNDSYMMNDFRNNGAGVSVMYSHGVKMLNNVFEENWGDGAYGLLLKEITDSYIEGNSFVRNTSGIYMEGASRIIMQKNLFKDNGWAMKIQASCMGISVSKNNFIGNTFDVGTNGTLVLNTFDNNYWDKYEGYDLNKDRVGDIPYRPVSMYSMIVEKNPSAMLLFRSFFASLLDKTEKIIPSLTPEMLKDNKPMMKKIF